MIELENISPHREQVCYDDTGKAFSLAPYEVRKFPPKIVSLFLDQCPGRVAKFEMCDLPREPGVAEVWLANNTGNPALPKMCISEVFDHNTKSYVQREVHNRILEPQTLQFRWSPGQRIENDKHINQPSKLVRLPPYTRRPVPISLAEAWLSSTAAMAEVGEETAIIISRAPGPFEPNDTWELNDLWVYLEMLQPGVPSVLGFKSTYDYEKPLNKKDEEEMLRVQEDHRVALWQSIYFALIDPAVNLPNERAYKNRMAAWLRDWADIEKAKQEAFGKPKKT